MMECPLPYTYDDFCKNIKAIQQRSQMAIQRGIIKEEDYKGKIMRIISVNEEKNVIKIAPVHGGKQITSQIYSVKDGGQSALHSFYNGSLILKNPSFLIGKVQFKK